MSGGDLGDLQNGLTSVGLMKSSLFIMTLFTFLVPALIFTWMEHRRGAFSFLGLREAPRLSWLLVTSAMLILMMPIIQYSFGINQQLPLPDWMSDMEDSAAETLQQLLVMKNPVELLLNLALIALLPALGEEIFFRGVIQRYGYGLFKNPAVSIWITALLFSAIHLQFEGFIPRFLLGLFLGYLFYWSSNLWLPILAHFLNNALMLVIAFFTPEDQLALDEAALPDLPVLVVVLATLLLIPAILFMKNISTAKNDL